MKRILNAVRRWWYGDNHGVHARPRGHVDFIDLSQQTIPRRPTLGRPPWETAPLPAICLMPAHVPDPPAMHPLVAAQLGADSVAELIERLFPNVPLPAAA